MQLTEEVTAGAYLAARGVIGLLATAAAFCSIALVRAPSFGLSASVAIIELFVAAMHGACILLILRGRRGSPSPGLSTRRLALISLLIAAVPLTITEGWFRSDELAFAREAATVPNARAGVYRSRWAPFSDYGLYCRDAEFFAND